VLIVVASVQKLIGVRIETPNLHMNAGADFHLDEGGVISFASLPAGPIEILDAGTPFAEILFGSEPLEGQRVIDSLKRNG
jgi:hypothetical protein